MKLSEAYYLATIIDVSPVADLIAIGRFLPADQLTPTSPWGCSVRLSCGRQQTVWSIADWVRLCAPAEPPSSPQRPPDTRRDAAHIRQPSLF